MEPLNYNSAFENIPSPQSALLEGLKMGGAMRAQQQAQEDREKAQIAAAQMSADLAALSQNPTTDAIGRMSLKYPQLSENFKRSFDILDPAQKQAKLEHASQVYAAINSGKPDVAQKILNDQAAALRNSGNEKDAKAAEMMATLVRDHPEMAKTSAGLILSAAVGPDKFAATYGAVGGEQRAQDLAPDVLRKTKAEAGTAESDEKVKAVDAKYADSKAMLDIEKKGWDVKKIKADIDIARESNRIAAMNAAANREGNTLKREELRLKIDDAKQARDDRINERVAKAESGISAMDNMLNTVARLKKNPSLKNVVGSIEGRLPSLLSDEGSDAIALLDTLGSQAFLSQVPVVQGTGQLSNSEGDKLQSALQNLSRSQSERQLNANLAEVERLVNKARVNVSNRYGVPLRAPDTPAANPETAPATDEAARVRAQADAILGGG